MPFEIVPADLAEAGDLHTVYATVFGREPFREPPSAAARWRDDSVPKHARCGRTTLGLDGAPRLGGTFRPGGAPRARRHAASTYPPARCRGRSCSSTAAGTV